ncbi:hypothetical protein BP6252_00042 [Coleophoma cylindrospora]|uniref:RGS domain-containing protein n=1 Tax=Coleophoma cylindrospora TaxID=1849047 RepID=A0A3D8SNX0_9HELO|nr:hypothetical protein BP6252_00042 [Coleophoma cylindrospora]
MPPSWMQWYKKPSYVDIKQFATSLQEKADRSATSTPRPSVELERPSTAEVPSKLNLERILKNQTCSPMSLHDFYMYLKHIEYSSENLEFYLWFLDYEASYTSNSYPPNDTDRPWPGTSCDKTSCRDSMRSTESQDESLDLEKGQSLFPGQVITALTSSAANAHALSMAGSGPCSRVKEEGHRSSVMSLSFASVFRAKVVENLALGETTPLNETARLMEARRRELQNISATYLIQGAPAELNIPFKMRNKALEAIATSSAPEHLKPIADHCYLLLRSCSHRNFVRLGVSNGTFETICMATSVGIAMTLAGFLCMLLLAFASPTIHQSSRWRGLASFPLWSIGIGLILSGLRGSCFFLLLFSRRQPLPWEKVEDDASIISAGPKKRNLWNSFFSKLMIFDRKMRVKDDNLRRLQRKIVFQSILGGVAFAVLMEIVFLVLPIWK